MLNLNRVDFERSLFGVDVGTDRRLAGVFRLLLAVDHLPFVLREDFDDFLEGNGGDDVAHAQLVHVLRDLVICVANVCGAQQDVLWVEASRTASLVIPDKVN